MDDLIFQCDNQNSIYILNSSNKSFEELARLNLIDSFGVRLGAAHSQKDIFGYPTQVVRSEIKTSSNPPRKLRNVTNFKANVAAKVGDVAGPTSTCLPATAIQKLFHCSSVANNNNTTNKPCNIENNRYTERDHLTTVEVDYKKEKKKSSNVKSSLIAKKSKFLQFLEEEKNTSSFRSPSSLPLENQEHSCVKKLASDTKSPPPPVSKHGPLNNYIRHFSMSKTKLIAATAGGQPTHQSSNWSGSDDSNNQQQPPLPPLPPSPSQQLQPFQQEHFQQPQRPRCDLYKEAAELLGLSCTLCDNCRCLDCQSSYFDCDDYDNYSEFSSMDDYDDDINVTSAMELVMHAKYFDDVSVPCCNFQGQEGRQLAPDGDISSNSCSNEMYREPGVKCAEKLTACRETVPSSSSSSIYCKCLSMGGDKDTHKTAATLSENAFHCQEQRQCQIIELENCASFNELSLTDSNDTCSNAAASKNRMKNEFAK